METITDTAAALREHFIGLGYDVADNDPYESPSLQYIKLKVMADRHTICWFRVYANTVSVSVAYGDVINGKIGADDRLKSFELVDMDFIPKLETHVSVLRVMVLQPG